MPIATRSSPAVKPPARGTAWSIAPAFVPWDRNDGTFSGPARVCVMAQVFDRQGKPVNNADAESCGVVEIQARED